LPPGKRGGERGERNKSAPAIELLRERRGAGPGNITGAVGREKKGKGGKFPFFNAHKVKRGRGEEED